jgi:hypothetical protein
VAEYAPASLFSFRLGEATATGAKTLLVPTPFAIRTALLDAAIRLEGVNGAPEAFRRIQGMRVAIKVPGRIAVTNLLVKVRKPRRTDSKKKGDEESEAMQATIAFREYAHLEGALGIGLRPQSREILEWAERLLPQVSYFGKRGGFFQLVGLPERKSELPPDFLVVGTEGPLWTEITGYPPARVPVGILQVLDDWGPDLTWEKVNVYSKAEIRLGSDRLRCRAVLPCRIVRSSRSFTYYERIG